ncbi:hypothetical protein KEM55_001629 [Ascosphaera atra]|nr:hypothetical protein KEM55_001629 [Ascosphaera atra]
MSTKDAPASASRSKPSIGVNTSSTATVTATATTTVSTTHTHPSTHSHHPHHHHSSRTTLNEMRRRVAAILEFISRTQLDMAANGERITPPDVAKKVVPGNDAVSTAAQAVGLAAAAATSQGTSGEGEGEGKNERESNGGTEIAKENAKYLAGERITIPEPEFEKLTSFDMMDVLTRGLLKWQQEFGNPN